jgi:hypothetical protein
LYAVLKIWPIFALGGQNAQFPTSTNVSPARTPFARTLRTESVLSDIESDDDAGTAGDEGDVDIETSDDEWRTSSTSKHDSAHLVAQLSRTVEGMAKAASVSSSARTAPTFDLSDLAPPSMVRFWLSNANYSKLFENERKTRTNAPAPSISSTIKKADKPSNRSHATLFDTTALRPMELHTRLRAVLNGISISGFIKWSDNMCHFDHPLAVKLACLVAVGSTYWRGSDVSGGTCRPLSRTERWDVDLMCSVSTNTEDQVQHLRNVYMWHFMDPFGFFGKPFDAMQHPAVCNDVDTDGWHSVQSSYTRKWEVQCMCDMKDASEFDSTDGIVRIIRTQLVGANHMQATNVQDAVVLTLAGQRTQPKHKCHQHVRGVARSTCVGMYTNTLVKLRLGPIVVVAVEAQSSYLPDVTPTIVIGKHTFSLIGMVLRCPGHYVARFWSAVDNLWYDYNDIATTKKNRVTPTPKAALRLSNPASFRGASYPVTGLWYADKNWDGEFKYVSSKDLAQQVDKLVKCRVKVVHSQKKQVV